MLRIRYTQAPGAAFSYFTGDKRLSTEERQGMWLGAASPALGLQEGRVVRPVELALGLDGYAASGLRFVRQMRRAGKRRAAYDVVIAPSKSVSLVGLMGPAEVREKVRRAYSESADFAFRLVERLAARQSRAARRTRSGKLVAAVFTHERSRYGDPHLHRHYLSLNVTQLADSSLWAVTMEFAMKAIVAIERLFQVDLVRRLLKEGVAAVLRNRIAEIPLPETLCQKFSRGHQEIEKTMARIERGGEVMGAKRRVSLRNIVNDRVRPRKHSAVKPEEWAERLTKPERAVLSRVGRARVQPPATLTEKELRTRVGRALSGKHGSELSVRWEALAGLLERDRDVDPMAAVAAIDRLNRPCVLPADEVADSGRSLTQARRQIEVRQRAQSELRQLAARVRV